MTKTTSRKVLVASRIVTWVSFIFYPFIKASMAQWVKNLPAMQETQEMQIRFLGWEDMLEKGVATHSSILAWIIPRIKEPGMLQSKGHRESDMTEQLPTHTH